jgi:hypothetical protein
VDDWVLEKKVVNGYQKSDERRGRMDWGLGLVQLIRCKITNIQTVCLLFLRGGMFVLELNESVMGT